MFPILAASVNVTCTVGLPTLMGISHGVCRQGNMFFWPCTYASSPALRFLQLNEQGLNVSLYWKNPDPRKFVNVVPTSAITGEGIPDLLQLIVKLTQSMMQERLMFVADTQCTGVNKVPQGDTRDVVYTCSSVNFITSLLASIRRRMFGCCWILLVS